MDHLHQFKIHPNEGRVARVHLLNIQALHKKINEKCFLCVLQGLGPSPHLGMKFKSQRRDEVNVNDFFHRSFGPGGVLIYKQSKGFFSVQGYTHRHKKITPISRLIHS